MSERTSRGYGTFRVVLRGGAPWGVALAGGSGSVCGSSAVGAPLHIAQVEPGSKAYVDGRLQAGDRVLRVNDISCEELAEARQMISSAFYTLTLTLWRGNNATPAADSELVESSSERLLPVDDGNRNGSHKGSSGDDEPSDVHRESSSERNLDDSPADMEKHSRKASWDRANSESFPRSFAHKTLGLARPAAAFPLTGLWQQALGSGSLLPSELATADGGDPLESRSGGGPNMNAAAKPAAVLSGTGRRNAQQPASQRSNGSLAVAADGSRLTAVCQQRPPRADQTTSVAVVVGRTSDGGRAVSGPVTTAAPSLGKENRGPAAAGVVAAAAAHAADCSSTSSGQGRWRLAPGEIVKQQAEPAAHKVPASRTDDAHDPRVTQRRHGGLGGSAADADSAHVVDAFGFMTGSLLPSTISPWKAQPSESGDSNAGTGTVVALHSGTWGCGGSSAPNDDAAISSESRSVSGASRWIQVSNRVLEAREAKVAKVEQHSFGSGLNSASGSYRSEGSTQAMAAPSITSNGSGTPGCIAAETEAAAPVSVRSIVSAFERPSAAVAAAPKLPAAVARLAAPESSAAAAGAAPGAGAGISNAAAPSTLRQVLRTTSDVPLVEALPPRPSNEALPPRPSASRSTIGGKAAPVTAATVDFLAADDQNHRDLDNRLSKHLSWYEEAGSVAPADADDSSTASGTSRLGSATVCSRRSFASRDDAVATFASSSAMGRPASSLNRTLSFAGSTNFASSATRGFARQRPKEFGRIATDSEERRSHGDAHTEARRWAAASSALGTTRELPMKRAAADFFSNQHKAKIQPNAAYEDDADQFYALDNGRAESQAGGVSPVPVGAYPSRGGGHWALQSEPGFSAARTDHSPFSLPASSSDGGCGGDDIDDRSSTATSSSCCSSAGCHDDRSYDGGRCSASPVAYLLDPGDGQRWQQKPNQQHRVAEQLLAPSMTSTAQNGSWQPQMQSPLLAPSSREKAIDGWSNGRGGATGGGAFTGSNGFSGNSSIGGGGASSEGSTRRLKRAVSTNILPSRSPAAASAAGASLYGGNSGPAATPSRQHQQPLQCQSPISGSGASIGCVTPREAQLNEYNERRSRPEAPTSSPVSEEAPMLPPRAAANQSGHHQQAAIIAAHQHFHSMSSLAPAEQRTASSSDHHLRSSSYRPPQPTFDFRGSRGYGVSADPAAARSQSPVGSQQQTNATQSRQRASNGGLRRVESYRVVPTSAASAAAADSSPGSRFDERDRSKQEIRQSLLDFYKQKTGTPADSSTGSPVAQDVRGDSDSPPLSAPGHLLVKQSPSRSSSRDFGMPWSRLSVASNGTVSVENDAKSTGAGIAVQLRRSGSFSSVVTDRSTGGVGIDGQRATFLQQNASASGSNSRAADSWCWSSPVSSPFVDGKPAVSSTSSSQSESSISGRVKKLPVAEVSPFSRTTTFTAEAENMNETSSCEPYSSSDSGPLPSSATATSPRKVGNVYVSSPSDSYSHYNGPPSPGSPPVLPPRNYRLNSGEAEAKTIKAASYEAAQLTGGGSPTSSEKIFDGQPTTTSYSGVRMRNKPAPVPLPTDALDRFSPTAGDDLDRDYREQLRRASASQYKRTSLSAASTSSQLSSPGASSPANRKSLHIDSDAEPAVTYRQRSSNGGSRPSSGVFRADEPRQRWSCEASQLMPPPLPVARNVEHARQGSLSCASPGFSSRSPVADEVFSARSSPLAADESAATVAAVSLLGVPRGGRERLETARPESARPMPSPDALSHRRSSSVTVETASPYGLSHATSISSVHAHSTSMLRADLEVATVLQPSPEDGIAEPRQSGAVAAAVNGCADALRFRSGFKTISMEIMENLKGLGISVSEKRFAEDVVDGGSKQECVSASPPAASADGDGGSAGEDVALTVVHVRQKSQEEILCDSKMQILAQSIEADDAAVSRVLAPPEGFRQASDYLSGVFDDLLRREQQRKARLSSCGAADKTGSSASPASLEFDSSSRESPACDSGIYCQQSPSAIVSHSRRLPSVSGDCDSGSMHTRLHEWLQNQDYCCSSPNSADSQKKKDELVSILRRKLELLRAEKETREAALKQNESTGEAVAAAVADKCSERDTSKYRSYVDDLDKITKLLLKLSRRLARAENDLRAAEALATVDGRRPPDEQQKAAAEQRRDSLRRQHEDALLLKDGIDRQRKSVSSSLQSCLSAEQYEQYEAFVVAKVALTMEHADVEDRIAFSEEQLGVLEKLVVTTTALPAPLSSLPLTNA